MSDASEVKRYIPDSTPIFLVGESTSEPTTCVVLGRDHDRIVAELKAEVERLKKEDAAMVSRLHAQSKVMAEKDLEIARQARVIEKLREQRDKCLEYVSFDVEIMDKELAAIEQGEGT